VPAETHVATAHVVEYVGARPIFVDVQRNTGNIDAVLIQEAITPRTKAIIVVHYLGLPCEMDNILNISDSHGIAVVEDCALALGAAYDGRQPGSLGVTGNFSFYPTKHMTTLEGGMLTTDDDAIAARVRKQRAFGYDKNLGERTQPGIYDIDMLGYNFRMSEAHAAVGVVQLDKLDDFVATRKRNTNVLVDILADIPEVTTFPIVSGSASSGCYCVNAVLPADGSLERAIVVKSLSEAGVGTSVHYPVALPLASFYREKYGYRVGQFPVAEWISGQAISLPVGPHLDEDDMIYIGTEFKQAVSKGRA
jgi:dTDP-4-amino-4,6-dideoxygalactose transaminase